MMEVIFLNRLIYNFNYFDNYNSFIEKMKENMLEGPYK